MNNIFIIAAVVSVTFLITKFIEMRFIDKDAKPLKFLIRDALLVYVSVIMGHFILSQLKPMIQEGGAISAPQVFTGNPEF